MDFQQVHIPLSVRQPGSARFGTMPFKPCPARVRAAHVLSIGIILALVACFRAGGSDMRVGKSALEHDVELPICAVRSAAAVQLD